MKLNARKMFDSKDRHILSGGKNVSKLDYYLIPKEAIVST